MYHSIDVEQNSIFTVSFETLRKQMMILKDHKIDCHHFGVEKPGVCITFDDGHIDNFTKAAPFLIDNKIPFIIFVISDYIGKKVNGLNYVDKLLLKEISASEFCTIGSHGKTHQPLTSLTINDLTNELIESRLALEDVVQTEVNFLSFPHGRFNQVVLNEGAKCQYRKFATSKPVGLSLNEKRLDLIPRHCIFNCDNEKTFTQKIYGKWDWIARLSD